LKLKVDVKLNEKNIRSAIMRGAENVIINQGIDITCKNCGGVFHMKAGTMNCPFCGQATQLTFDS